MTSFTFNPSVVIAGELVVAKCCGTGYPQLDVKINGSAVQWPFTKDENGVFHTCSTNTYSTSYGSVETILNATCTVKYRRFVPSCTRFGVPTALEKCEKASQPGAAASATTTALITGEYKPLVPLRIVFHKRARYVYPGHNPGVLF